MLYNLGRRYTYSQNNRHSLLFLLAVFAAADLLSIIGLIAYWSLSPADGRAILISLIIAFSIVLCILPNLMPEIEVTDTGLQVQIFLFWWAFIPWREVKDIRRIFAGGDRFRLVVVKELSFIHRVIGAGYGTFFQPAFLISRKINGYNELVRLIEQHQGGE